jgi:hypothetical protein
MISPFLKYIRSKNRAAWREVAHKLLFLIRDWLGKNGEISALIGLVAGIAFVLFFKLVMVLCIFTSLVLFLLYQYAEE